MYICIYVYICTYVNMYICICVNLFICIYVYFYFIGRQMALASSSRQSGAAWSIPETALWKFQRHTAIKCRMPSSIAKMISMSWLLGKPMLCEGQHMFLEQTICWGPTGKEQNEMCLVQKKFQQGSSLKFQLQLWRSTRNMPWQRQP